MPLSSRGIFFWFAAVRGHRRFDPPQGWCYGSPMRRAAMLVAMAWALGGVGCGGKQVPQHSGYKGKKPTPWTKAKAIELDEELKAKVSGELDYGTYKRAKWFSLTPPGPGSVALDFEFVPGGDAEIDVAFEVLDPNNKVIVRADAEAEDTTEQKKQRSFEVEDGTYLIHVYLEGRMDAADFDLKLAYTRGERKWKSDFPNQVPYPDELAAVPPFDDTPASAPTPKCGVPGKPKCPKRCGTPGAAPCKPPPPPDEKCGVPGKPPCAMPPLAAAITNVDPDPAGARITIAAGTADGVDNGMSGKVTGVKNSSFRTSGCTAQRCNAVVKAAVDDVRSSGEVVIQRK